jgi:hypothetical protein
MFKRPWTTVLVVAVACFAFTACRSGQETEHAAVAPELKLEGVHFRVWRGAVLRASGEARLVTLRRDTNEVTAQDLRAELPAAGQPVELEAPSASGVLSSQEFTAQGGVVVTHGGERASTDRARYLPGPSGKGLVLGDDPVVVERGALHLSGVGFSFDPASGELQLGGPVATHAAGAAAGAGEQAR